MGTKRIFDAKEYKDVKELLYGSAEKFGNKTAFTIKHQNGKEAEYDNKSFKDLLEDINEFGTGIFDLGFKGKHRIAVIGKNRYEWAVAHLSNLLGGNICVPLDKDLQYEELEMSLIRSKAEVIIFDEKLTDNIKKLKENNKTLLKEFICMSKIDDFKSLDEIKDKGEEILESGNREFLDVKIDENELAILLFTSGTTSASKAVMLSQRNVATNVYDLQSVEDINDKDVNIALLPFHHIFGSTCMLYVLACGVKTVFADGLKYVKKNLAEYEVSMFVGVPLLVESIYKAVKKEVEKQGKTKLINTAMKVSNFLLKFKIDIRRKLFKQVLDGLGGALRFIIVGGAPADPEVLKYFNDLGIITLQGYGLSETSPVIAAENYKVRKNGTVGVAMPSNTIEITNPDDKGIGEIRVKGPNVMLGYYEMDEITNEVLKDGWFYTGDLGYFDKENILVITGRTKNMIVLKNGKKVFPEEIETLVNRLDEVEESFVFGMPDEQDKNDVTLSVKVFYNKEFISEHYGDKTDEEIYEIIWNKIKDLNQTFPTYKHIKKLIITDKELIKTTTKKVKRQEELKLILETK